MSLILAVLLIGQAAPLVDNIDRGPLPDPAAELDRWRAAHGVAKVAEKVATTTGPTRADLEMTAAVEEWVHESRPFALPPEPFRDLFARMGRSAWWEREAASKEAMAAFAGRPDDARWLFWGRRYSDPEVRLRCNTILRRLHPCESCKGDRKSKNWDAWPCSTCDGIGTAWPYAIWD